VQGDNFIVSNPGAVRESTLTIPGPREPIPVWILEPACGRCAATVLFYHGLGASKDIQRKEQEHLARRGFRAVGVDAVAHGERRWPDLDRRMEVRPDLVLLEIVWRSAEEVGTIIDFLSDGNTSDGHSWGIAGISMGGFIAFASALHEDRLSVMTPILGSPDWHVLGGPSAGSSPALRDLLALSPHLHPEAFSDRAVLALNAGRDVNVPPEPARRFIHDLKQRYPRRADHFENVEYPDSEHFMRPQDWDDLLERVAEWFARFTGC
jgi:uncharacterized protein